MRGVLVFGLISLSLSCGDKGSAENPDAVAGKVIEVEGQVSATRSGETRALTQGGEIYASDVIETSAGASALIRLAHNNANWQLGESMTMQVDKSTAWRAPKSTDAPLVAGNTDSDSNIAAGRHSEKEAGENAATAIANRAEPAKKRAKRPKPQPKPAPKQDPKPPPPPPPNFALKGDVDVASDQASAPGEGGGGETRSSSGKGKESKKAPIIKSPLEKAPAGAAVARAIRAAANGCKEFGKPGRVLITVTFDDASKGKAVSVNPKDKYAELSKCIAGKLVGKKLEGATKRSTVSIVFK